LLNSTEGRIIIKLRADVAPHHAERLKQLAREHFYDNVPFHRVIPGFMAQTGDGQYGNGTGGSKYPDLKAEFSNVPFTHGVVGMARKRQQQRFRQQPVLHHVCRWPVPERQIQRDWRGRAGHGCSRQAEKNGEPPPNPDKIVHMQVAADAK
jgi:peptidylprolyl isomerase